MKNAVITPIARAPHAASRVLIQGLLWAASPALALLASATPAMAAQGAAGGDAHVAICRADPFLGKERTLRVPANVASILVGRGAYAGPCATYGDTATLGNGQARTFVQLNPDGTPHAMGLEMAEAVLSNLPAEEGDGNNCWDLNGDGQWGHGECAGGHQRILFFPKVKNTPFHWFLLNWMPHGHDPKGIYSVAHFDMHFYTQDLLARNRIRPGPCGIVINCDDFAVATKPVPAKYMPQGYQSVGAAAVREGDHLLDLTSPEFGPAGSRDFAHTFIFGAYDGHLTFWEPMIALAYLQKRVSQCTAIKLPSAYEVAGHYPTAYCIRYRSDRKDYAITLEKFQYRQSH